MNRSDDELLARQLRNAGTPPTDSVLGPAMLAVFVVGFLLGGLLFTQRGEAPRNPHVVASIAAPDAPAVIRR